MVKPAAMTPEKKRLAILISGRGSNMEAILRACADPGFPAEPAVVISDRKDAKGLETARAKSVSAIALERTDHENRQAHEAAIDAVLAEHGADLICLAGYMRILSPGFTRRHAGKLINIHPSLLPEFKGLDTHARALAAGVREHGCTVHWVNEEMDGGEIIAQARVPLLAGDTAETLADRVLQEEHKLYPAVIEQLCRS